MDERITDVTGDELLARLQSRKEFLKLLSAAGIGAAAGVSMLPRAAEGAVRTRLEPTDFSFTTRDQFRPFHLLAKNFVTLDDSFNTNTLGNYTILRPGPPPGGEPGENEDDGFVRIGDGEARFDGQDDYYTILKSNTGQKAPFSTVIIDVASLPEEGTVYAGLYRDETEFVHAYYDSDTNTVGFEVRVNGQDYRTDNSDGPFSMGRPAEPEQRLFEEPFRFAFVANENRVIALVSSASDLGGWRPIIERDVFFETNGQMDLRDQSRLEPSPTALRNGFGARSETGSNILIGRVQAGYFGEAGVRDPHVVQYADGTPYIKNGKLYFTLTNAGLGFFEKAHWGVWTMDLSNYRNIEQVGNIFWRNAPPSNVPPNKVLGHHAGQIIRDEEFNGGVGRWIVVVSSWGDFGPQGGDGALVPGVITYPDKGSFDIAVRDPEPNDPDNPLVPVEPGYEPPVDILYAEDPASPGGLPLATNILTGVHVLDGKKHPVNAVPFPTEGKWDPGLTRINGRWYMAYVIALDLFSNFQPALARSPVGADHLQATEFVGADWEKRATEGSIIQKLGGEWRMFASCGDDEPPEFQGRYPIYFLEAANPGAPDGASDVDRPRDFDPNRKEPPTAEEERLRRLAFDGYLDAPHPTNIPHPQIVPIPIVRNGRRMTKYIMITFNGDQYYEWLLGYGTHGDFYVMQAEQIVRGWEFPRR